jgi:hypothetical protein
MEFSKGKTKKNLVNSKIGLVKQVQLKKRITWQNYWQRMEGDFYFYFFAYLYSQQFLSNWTTSLFCWIEAWALPAGAHSDLIMNRIEALN